MDRYTQYQAAQAAQHLKKLTAGNTKLNIMSPNLPAKPRSLLTEMFTGLPTPPPTPPPQSTSKSIRFVDTAYSGASQAKTFREAWFNDEQLNREPTLAEQQLERDGIERLEWIQSKDWTFGEDASGRWWREIGEPKGWTRRDQKWQTAFYDEMMKAKAKGRKAGKKDKLTFLQSLKGKGKGKDKEEKDEDDWDWDFQEELEEVTRWSG